MIAQQAVIIVSLHIQFDVMFGANPVMFGAAGVMFGALQRTYEHLLPRRQVTRPKANRQSRRSKVSVRSRNLDDPLVHAGPSKQGCKAALLGWTSLKKSKTHATVCGKPQISTGG
ncbi:MAG: hypothetical protein ACRESJ_10020 [Pseudomonas sp.]|uniref:hypothetical protein n=1 Tax=Pseudomonas sp. TaxID=306 RepID=UPI003D6FCFD8